MSVSAQLGTSAYTNSFKKISGPVVERDGLIQVPEQDVSKIKYIEYLPTWTKEEKYITLKFFKHVDPGSRADPEFGLLFPKSGSSIRKPITPKFGTTVENVQLSQLDAKGKDELALLVAQRGVVVFKNQDLAEKGPRFAVEYGKHFGPLHIHPTSGAPPNAPELHTVYRTPKVENLFEHSVNLLGWHSDVTYEMQPAGTTFFSVIQGPEAGGDTLFANTAEAYERLSPAWQEFLGGLSAVHSAVQQASASKNEIGIVKRDAVENIHPIIRTHPVTGKKSIFVNSGFTRSIVGLKSEESATILNFLFDLIGNSHDLQLRVKWEPNTVVIWDNRVTNHTAIFDWDSSEPRLAFRITPQAERPVNNLVDLNKEDTNKVYKGQL